MHRFLLPLCIAVLAAACGHRPHETTIPHPASTGSIAEHAIEVPDRDGDRGYHVGAFGVKKHQGPEVSRGTMTDRVRLVRLDATAICFDFEIVARTPDAPEFNAPNDASIAVPKGHASVRPTVEPKPPQQTEISGQTAEHLEQGAAEYPGDDGYRLVRNQARVAVHTGGAKVCFANEGIVTPQTRSLRLHTSTGDYAWTLDGDAKAWPSDSIVYSGKIQPYLR